MRKMVSALAVAAMMVSAAGAAQAQSRGSSSGRQAQVAGMREIPRCTRNLGSIAIVEPENQWWRELNLGSPEAVLRLFVQRSGCFTLVNRGRSMQSRAMERALADNGELQSGSNIGRGQVRAADYFLEPNIISSNRNAGGANVGGIMGGLIGGTVGGIIGGINVSRREANVTLSVVNARTTEEEALTEGYYRKTDVGFNVGAGAGWWGGLAGVGGGAYQNTEIGQVIVLAYLDAYLQLVQQLGGLPADASAAAPRAR